LAESAAADFFEARIRPLLAEHCIECHGPKEQSGQLRLDSREALLTGGEHGAAITPGDPAKSRLMAAVRREGELKMPPDKPLSQEQVAALTEWVKLGAPWPKSSPRIAIDPHDPASEHWAFQPVRNPEIPKIDDAQATANPIDAFVLEKLRAADLPMSPRADARTLIRRATFDLTGLPPTAEEVEAFLKEHRRDGQAAYERLIDRLLASPHYGEQWARHWLDVARYSDTKGYVYAREERFWVHAWAYRDWVVRALNEDLPYDRFLLLQLAADQLAGDDRRDLAAMGFLTLGRRFLGVPHDIIDDRIDVVTRGMLGLTVACARCHDHKYDPVPTRDYYSLYGVFQNCRQRLVPIAQVDTSDPKAKAFDEELKAREQKLADTFKQARDEASERVRNRVGDYLLAQLELAKYPAEGFDQILAKDDIMPAFVRRWQSYLANASQTRDPVFVPWHAFASLERKQFAEQAEAAAAALANQLPSETNALVAEQFRSPPSSMQQVCQRYAELFAKVNEEWRHALAEAKEAGRPAPTAFDDEAAEALRQVLYGAHAPCVVPDEPIVHTESFFDLKTCEQLWKLQGEVDRHLIRSPQSPAQALILVDCQRTTPAYVFRRGNPANKGELAPRQFLEVLSGASRKPFKHGSGRLELARCIATADNPLTARVMVNRVWMHHFGAGLVTTPSDFGRRAEPPSHPKLLDWLACRFVEDGWSLKRLHRRMMLSATYRQSSLESGDASAHGRARQLDPENRLLWRANARRLSLEELRDALLAVSGRLDLKLGGKPANLFDNSFRRRTLYGLIDRQFLPSTLRVFDFANPDLHIPERSETTAPQQALFFLNHPLSIELARALAERSKASDPAEQVRQMVRLAYQREATPDEVTLGLELVKAATLEPLPVPPHTVVDWQYGYGKVDEAAQKLVSFQPLPHFTGKAWQGGRQWPDSKLGWVQLTADGGHAGNDLEHAAVRRWTAPTDMTVVIESQLAHSITKGDGVRGFLLHSGTGLLKSAELHNARADFNIDSLEVRRGETINFVVDIGKGLNNDQFTWRVEIKPAAAAGSQPTNIWNARRDFHGPATDRLDPWQQLAQVLLAANEFMFVD
jgi:hypothetical protein